MWTVWKRLRYSPPCSKFLYAPPTPFSRLTSTSRPMTTRGGELWYQTFSFFISFIQAQLYIKYSFKLLYSCYTIAKNKKHDEIRRYAWLGRSVSHFRLETDKRGSEARKTNESFDNLKTTLKHEYTIFSFIVAFLDGLGMTELLFNKRLQVLVKSKDTDERFVLIVYVLFLNTNTA